MAKAELVLQALTNRPHAAAITEIMALPKPVSCLFSVAFARSAGVASIEASIAALKIKPRVFVGIRNDITSIQALHQLLSLGVQLYTVDTGARRPIFHPKLYLISARKSAKAIIGSANLTHYGLQNNIEISTLLDLDLKREEDAKFVDSIMESFDALIKNHPKHVQLIGTTEEANALFEQGRLCDEDVVVAPSVTQQAPKVGGIELAPMKLTHFNAQPKPKKNGAEVKSSIKKATRAFSKTQFVRVWRSKPLVARDLSVPEGKNTSLTGSMGLKQDAVEDFDFQTHFRKIVFGELSWKPKTKEPLKEEAKASFQFIIENIDYGTFELKVAHDKRTNTKTYLQRNFMTQLHWGIARPIIARRDLVGRKLMLYKKNSSPPEYLIEID
jgi:HKD family nuclease